MHTSTSSSSNSPEGRALREVVIRTFGRRNLSAARAFVDRASRRVGLRSALLIAASVRAFSESAQDFLGNLVSLRKLKFRAAFFGEQHSVRLVKNGECLFKVQPKDLDASVNAFYFAALHRFYSAMKALRIELSFKKSDLFSAISTKVRQDDSARRRERLEFVAKANKMLLIAAMIRKNPEWCIRILLSENLISSRNFKLEELSAFVDGVYKNLQVGQKETASFNSAVNDRTLTQLGRSLEPTSLILGGEKRLNSVVVCNRLVDETVQTMVEWIEALASFYKPLQTIYGSEALLESCSGGEPLLSRLSNDLVPPSISGAAEPYKLGYVLYCLGQFSGSGARVVRAANFAKTASDWVTSEEPLSLLSIDYSLSTFGEEQTLRAIKLADSLGSLGTNERYAFNLEVERSSQDISLAFSVPSIHLAIRVLEALQISPDSDRASYLTLAALAARMGRLEPERIKKVLRAAKGVSIELEGFVEVMLPIWQSTEIPDSPSGLVEQIERHGYRQLLIDWVGSEQLVDLSYVAIGQSFNASYRHIIQELKARDVPESSWVSFLKQELVAAFTAAYVQGRFAEPPYKEAADLFLEKRILIDSPPYILPEGKKPSPDFVRCYNESVRTIFRALSLYYGQGALMIAARRSAPDRATQIEDFALHCCTQHQFVRGRGDIFPGSGVWMKGLEIKKLVPAANVEEWLGEVLPSISQAKSSLANSSVFYMRGCRIVLPPATDDFHVFGKAAALISFQDHFGDPKRHGVLVVSREAAEDICDSICSRAFMPKDSSDIFKRCETVGGWVLLLSSISCLGGLCNSIPVGKTPLWEWERQLPGSGFSRDFTGHLHKFYNTWDSRGLAQFAAAHDEIYRVASRLFDLEIAWRIGMQRYQLGHFYGTEAGEDIYTDGSIEGDFKFPKFGYRALIAAMRWHVDLKSAGVSEESSYPVIVIANPRDHWNGPSTYVSLDTRNMKLSEGGVSHQLTVPTDLSGDDELEIASRISDVDKFAWRLRMWGPAENQGFEFRSEHRNRLHLR